MKKQYQKLSNPKTIKIAFSGSGFLAPIHAGFACGIMDANYKIIEVAGTSGGSIVASLLATGATQKTIKDVVFAPYPKGIVEKSYWKIATAIMNNEFYVNDGTILSQYLYEYLADSTFKSVNIPITIMATNLSKDDVQEFSREKTPDVKLVFASRASSSVPYIYKPVEYNGDLLVDGGVRNNIPTNKLSSGGLKVGVRIIDGGNSNVNNILRFSQQLINNLLDSNEDNLDSWAESTGTTIVKISGDPYNFLDARIDLTGKKDMFNRGYQAAKQFLSQHGQH